MTTPAEEATASPYQGLMPYTESRADLFFGRDQDIVLIANNARAYPFSLLYGPSGVGKSSVLQAGVLRHIRRENEQRLEQFGSIETVVAYTSDWRDDPSTLLARAVEDAFRDTLDAAPEIGDHLDADAILSFCAEREVDLLLILDQFEEFFLYHQDAVAEFADELAGLLRPGARANVLLSIREDALAQLDQFEDAIPGVFDHTLRLEHLDDESARSAIIEPIRYHNELVEPSARREIEPALVDALITEVQAGRVRVDQAGGHGGSAAARETAPGDEVQVEAPFLQLVLTRLWDEEAERGSSTLRASTLVDLGGAQEIVRQHLDRVVHLFNADELEIMVDAFGHLVTPSGSKIAHTASDLAELTDHDPGEMADVLRRLCRGDQRILREVPGPLDQVDAEPRFEIFHDVLALAVLDWRRRWLAETQRTQLAEAKAEAERESQEAHRRLRRARLVISGLGLLVAACLILALVAVSARSAAARNAALEDVNQLLETDPAEALTRALDSWKPGASPEYEDAFRTALDMADTEVKLTLGSPMVESFFVRRDLVTVSENGIVQLWRGAVSDGRYTIAERPMFEADVTDGDDKGRVISAALADDQRFVVTSTDAGYTHRVDLDSGEVQPLPTQSADQLFVVASAEGTGRFVLLYDEFDRGLVYDVRSAEVVDLPEFPNVITGGAIDASGTHVATFREGGAVAVWNLETKELIKSARVRSDSNADVLALTGVFTNTSGRRLQLHLAAATSDAGGDEFHTWDVSREKSPVFTMYGDTNINDVAVDSEGLLALATWKWIEVVDGEFFIGSNVASNHDLITEVEFAPKESYAPDIDGINLLALGARTGEVEIYADYGDFPLRRFLGHSAPITSLRFSEDGLHLVTSSSDGSVRVWRMPRADVRWYADEGGWVVQARYTPDGRYVIGSDEYGNVMRIDRRGKRTKPRSDGDLDTRTLDPAPSGDAAVGVPTDESDDVPTIVTFDKREKPILTPVSEWLTVARWNPVESRREIAGGTSTNVLQLWDIDSDETRTILLGDTRYGVAAMEYTADGERIAAISEEGIVSVANVTNGEIERQWRAPRSSTIDISRDGRYVVTAGDEDQKVRIWDVEHPERPIHELTQAQGQGFISSVTLSPDARSTRVAATTAEGLTYVWERSSGRLLSTLRHHADYVREVSFDPQDIDTLSSASDDFTITTYECDLCSVSSGQLEKEARTRLAQVIDLSAASGPRTWGPPLVDLDDGD